MPAFAGIPTALLLLNAQLDGVVVLGVGGAIALWSRPYLAGLTLGLTLMKPQLVLPFGVALVLARRWTVIAGWATAGAALLVPTLILNPHWILDWLGQTRSTVQAGAREVDLASAVKLALVPEESEGNAGALSWAGHYEAAGQAGSDFWAVYPLGAGRIRDGPQQCGPIFLAPKGARQKGANEGNFHEGQGRVSLVIL